MSSFVIEPPKVAAVAVRGSAQKFPVRRIYCIGRNYAAHTIEMGGDPNREAPFFFQKNPDNISLSGEFKYPPKSTDVHHELELVIALKKGGANISVKNALSHVYGYAVGLDMTRRDLQGEMKKAGRPWEIGKAFEGSAPITALVPAAEIGHPDSGTVRLEINNTLRQEGDLNQMIWKTPEIIAYLSEYFELAPGDMIMSGTPSGVGPVVVGDVMKGTIEGVGELTVKVI
ncbi:MAG: fumarylacetoacetate hydrolase family protein [Deltaproteobacteria bacterium]|nr:fumarylacetoacetate hydrolase family protein [Deltaproteobacteria bacterium]